MPFQFNQGVHQGAGLPRCGAACAVYVAHWLANEDLTVRLDGGNGPIGNEVGRAMRTTRFGFVDDLGSTPANIAKYLDRICNRNNLHCRIYAPTEVVTNWSTRPWYPAMRAGLQFSTHVNFSLGSECLMPVGQLGQDYLIIRVISPRIRPPFRGQYFPAHFIVDIGAALGGDDIMDPDGGHIRDKQQYMGGQYSAGLVDPNLGWASIGLDLRVYRN